MFTDGVDVSENEETKQHLKTIKMSHNITRYLMNVQCNSICRNRVYKEQLSRLSS